MKQAFHEDMHSKLANVLDAQVYDFDWQHLFTRLDGCELTGADHERLTEAFRVLLDWLLAVGTITPNSPSIIGRRVIALAWVLNPGYFANSPSLTQLAEDLGFTAPLLSALTAAVTRRFGVRNRAQANWIERQDKLNTPTKVAKP